MAGSAEPLARGTNFVASRRAVLDLWGEAGLAEVAQQLPDDARRDTVDAMVITAESWLPERYNQAWYEAIWNGPAHRLAPEFRRFIDRRIDGGFGRVRRYLLQIATPHMLAQRV